jgi:hypothetical protein
MKRRINETHDGENSADDSAAVGQEMAKRASSLLDAHAQG